MAHQHGQFHDLQRQFGHFVLFVYPVGEDFPIGVLNPRRIGLRLLYPCGIGLRPVVFHNLRQFVQHRGQIGERFAQNTANFLHILVKVPVDLLIRARLDIQHHAILRLKRQVPAEQRLLTMDFFW